MSVARDMQNPVSLISVNKYRSDVVRENSEQRVYVNKAFEDTEQAKTSDSGLAEIKEKSHPNIPAIGFFNLFRYASVGDKILIIFATCVAMISGVCSPVQMVIFGKVVDILVDYDAGRKNTSNVSMSAEYLLEETATFSLWTAFCGLGFLVTKYVMVSCFSIAAANQIFRIRCMFMESILKQDIGWFDTNKTGDFASRISGDMSKIQDGLGDKVPILISFISSTILSFASAFYYGWKLSLVILSVSPILIGGMALLSKNQANASKEELEAYGTAGAMAEEVLSGIRTVVAFGGEKKEIQRYDNYLLAARKKGIKRGLMTATGDSLTWFCIYGVYGLAFWYGVKLMLEDRDQPDPEYTGGVLVTVLFNIVMGSIYFGQAAPYFEALALARGAAAKVFDIIDRKSVIDSSSDSGLRLPSLQGNINFRDVYFSYPARTSVPVLRGLSLTVSPGETVAVVGASGCGKSTVVQLILRFYDADAGSVQLDGHDVKDLNIGWLRDNIGLVGQEPVLFSTTIAENIKLGKRDATDEEVLAAAKIANAHTFIEALPLQYNTLVGERGTQLSGGQKQRIAIARALVRNPKILLLDEATSALDTESEAVVQSALDQARLGRTTIIIAHRLSTIKTADKIVVVSDGVVKEVGTHNELMEMKGSYYQLILTQTNESDEKEEKDLRVLETRADSTAVLNESSEGIELQDYSNNCNSFRRSLENGFHEGNNSKTEIPVVGDDEDAEAEKAELSKMRLLKISAPEWPYAIIGGLSAMLIGLHLPLIGVIFGEMLGVFSLPTEMIPEKADHICLLFLIMSTTAFIFSFLQTFMLSFVGERLTTRLRKMIFTNIITQDIAFFDHPKNSVGSLCSRLTNDASHVQGATGSRIATGLHATSTFVACLVIGFWYNYKMGFVIFPFVPFIVLAFYLEGRVISSHMFVEEAGFEAASKIAIEAIESIRTVASLHEEKTFFIKFKDALLEPHKKSRFKSQIRGIIYGFVQSVQAFAYAAGIYYGCILVAKDEIAYSDLMKVLEGVLVGIMMVGETIGFAPDYHKAKVGAIRIFKLLDLKPRIHIFSEHGKTLENLDGYIRFEKVRFRYPSRPDVRVLNGLNFEIEPGKTVALVGSSGCGKSTCVQLIERFYDVERGKVVIDNENIKEMNVADLRSHIGLVSQEPILFSYSIAENIAYGDNSRDIDMNRVISAARQANIHNFITTLPKGYDTPLGERGTQLSGGQKQRVAIARALLRNPKILLLDEATSALDAESEKIVQEALDKARTGRTCLIIAHRLTTIQNADTILVIHKGRIVEKGTHQELLNQRGHYYKLQSREVGALRQEG